MSDSSEQSTAGWVRQIETLIDALPDAVAIIDAQTATYIAVNAASCRVMGYSREVLMARGPIAVIGDPHITIDVLLRRYSQLVERHPEPSVHVTIQKRADGSLLRTTIHRQAANLFGRWVVVLRVIAHEGEILHDAEVPFRNVVDLSTDAVAIVDVDRMCLIDVNRGATELLGFARDELLAKGLAAGFAEASEDALQGLFARLIAQSPRARVTEAELRRQDGTMVPVQITQQAVDEHGRWIIILTARDITERIESQRALERRLDELARSNQELERFAYIASHDLMEPLRMMASFTQLLDRRYRGRLDPDADEFIDFIVAGATRMKQLLEDLLAYSRVGRKTAAPREVPMDSVLDDVLANLQVLIGEKRATVERGPLPVLRCDRTEMTQLLQNLVGNALKFQDGSRAATVRIGARDDGKAWTIDVADNGIGIDPEFFDRIFILFQRLHDRETYGGTGIGLAICKKIVENLGGRIWVDSPPGEGTTFHCTIPHAGGARA